MNRKPSYATKETTFLEVVHLLRVIAAARHSLVDRNDPYWTASLLQESTRPLRGLTRPQ